MKRILVIGSLNMDISVAMERAPKGGETLTGKSLLTSPGGKGANQAYAAGKLGGNVEMLGAVGQDGSGDALLANLKSVGVCVDHILRVPGVSTGTAVIFVEETGENRIVIVPGTNQLVTREYIDANIESIKAADIVVMQLEIPLDTVVYAAKLAHELGKTVIVDPAPANANIPKELWAYVDYIKPNETELTMILSGSIDGLPLEEALNKVQGMGVKNVWVTMGGKGVFVRNEKGEEKTIPSIRVKAVDTTAAGDTFLASAAVALAKGCSDSEAIRYGNLAAAIAVTRPGAAASVPSPEEVEAFAKTLE